MNRRNFMKLGACLGMTKAIPDWGWGFHPIRTPIGGRIHVYAGAIPNAPSKIDPAMLLSTVKLEPFSTILNEGIQSKGIKPGIIENTGVATHFIMESPSGNYQGVGTVGMSAGATIILANNNLVSGGLLTLDHVRFWFGKYKPKKRQKLPEGMEPGFVERILYLDGFGVHT